MNQALDRALKAHRPLVRRIARQVHLNMPASVDLDDLMQAGLIGLADAFSRFDQARGVAFDSFAAPRIRGAMTDYLRSIDWASRGDRRRQRKIADVVRRLGHELGRNPRDAEVAEAMGMELAEFHTLIAHADRARSAYLDELDESRIATDDSAAHDQRMSDDLQAAIQGLPDRERLVICELYERSAPAAEVAAALGVTETRVYQLRRSAVTMLRAKLSSP